MPFTDFILIAALGGIVIFGIWFVKKIRNHGA